MRGTKGFIDYWWPCPECHCPSHDLVTWSGVEVWKRIFCSPQSVPRCTVWTFYLGRYSCHGCWKVGNRLQITQ